MPYLIGNMAERVWKTSFLLKVIKYEIGEEGSSSIDPQIFDRMHQRSSIACQHSRIPRNSRLIITGSTIFRNRQSQILRNKTPFMHYRTFLFLGLVLALLLVVAGCSSPSQPVVTPTPTQIPTTEPTIPPTPVPTTIVSTIPGPTDTLPPQWPVSVTVEKSGMYSTTIITHFDGGKGLIFVSRMDVRVTHPDGTVLTDGIAKPKMGDTVEIPGTNGTDRVEVLLTMANGEVYKVVDEQVAYKSL